MAKTRNNTGTKIRKTSRVQEAEAGIESERETEEISTPQSSKSKKQIKKYPTPNNSSRPGSSKTRPSSRSSSDKVNTTPGKITKKLMKEGKKREITEAEIVKSKDVKGLIAIMNSLVNNEQDEIYNKFKKQNEEVISKDEEIIREMSEKIEQQQETIEQLIGMIPKKDSNESILQLNETPLKGKKLGEEYPDLSYNNTAQTTYESPIRKKKNITNQFTNEPELINEDQLNKELKTISIILDMLELLTGLRIVNYEEDESKFYFDVKQKDFEIAAEVNYLPTFLNDLEDEDEERRINSKKLLEVLPDYFCDNLTFPYNTLSQFYSKMNKALNKSVKK
ncbi:hypothetical protein QCA50_015771 [Cerrena zonata]|uniref:Monopolin complex subunit Csm1/Pcs1 C-terminal domain-containing protein n=1 Tax=Cerrena zonata TaxID=2478898 RepID=A0AAW0FKN1_9APHY